MNSCLPSVPWVIPSLGTYCKLRWRKATREPAPDADRTESETDHALLRASLLDMLRQIQLQMFGGAKSSKGTHDSQDECCTGFLEGIQRFDPFDPASICSPSHQIGEIPICGTTNTRLIHDSHCYETSTRLRLLQVFKRHPRSMHCEVSVMSPLAHTRSTNFDDVHIAWAPPRFCESRQQTILCVMVSQCAPCPG